MRKFWAEWLFDGQNLKANQSLALDDAGLLVEIQAGKMEGAEALDGLLSVPLVNAHCHLELSHLKGKIPEHTGMAGFVKSLQPIRDQFSEEEKQLAIHSALDGMFAEGILGLGDICNGTSSLAAKQAKPQMQFHNFIELFGLDPTQGENIFFRGLDLLREFGRNTSITPHAPYSVSKALRDKLFGYAQRREWPLSIHMLESKEERQLFEDLEGPLMDFIMGIGAVFQAHTYHSPLEYLSEGLPDNCNTLFVHCTEMQEQELDKLMQAHPRSYIALCPLANAYIHGSQPDASMFAKYPDRICLGTDSLAGNHLLSIWAEMQALQENQGVPAETLLKWGSLNGANALGLKTEPFQLEIGKKPGLIHHPTFRPDNIHPSTVSYLNL